MPPHRHAVTPCSFKKPASSPWPFALGRHNRAGYDFSCFNRCDQKLPRLAVMSENLSVFIRNRCYLFHFSNNPSSFSAAFVIQSPSKSSIRPASHRLAKLRIDRQPRQNIKDPFSAATSIELAVTKRLRFSCHSPGIPDSSYFPRRPIPECSSYSHVDGFGDNHGKPAPAAR